MAVTMTSGTVAGHACRFAVALRDGNPTPVVTQMSMTVPLSLEDIEAVLWFVSPGLDDADWADEEYLHGLVAGTVLAENFTAIEAARLQMAAVTPGSDEYEFAQWLRRRVRQLYPPEPVRPRERELAGVGARSGEVV